MGEYGVPKEMLTDNGRQYTNWRGTTRFEQELKKERIRHIWSRPHHPMTLGKIEHTQGECKSYLRTCAWKAGSDEGMELLAELGAHDLNHKHRRTLNGQNFCQAYFGCPRISFDRRTRREVFLWIKQATFDMLIKLGDDGLYMTAWRIAARTWLQKTATLPSSGMEKCYPVIIESSVIISYAAHSITLIRRNHGSYRNFNPR
jgi:hypothetical protein